MTVEERLRLLTLIERINNCSIAKHSPDGCRLCPVCEANLALIKDFVMREAE